MPNMNELNLQNLDVLLNELKENKKKFEKLYKKLMVNSKKYLITAFAIIAVSLTCFSIINPANLASSLISICSGSILYQTAYYLLKGDCEYNHEIFKLTKIIEQVENLIETRERIAISLNSLSTDLRDEINDLSNESDNIAHQNQMLRIELNEISNVNNRNRLFNQPHKQEEKSNKAPLKEEKNGGYNPIAAQPR